MTSYRKIGLIAGRGKLPHAVLSGAEQSGMQVYVAALTGFSEADDFDAPAGQFRLGDFGKLIKTLRREKVEAITFAGIVTRPDFKAMRPDMGAMKYLPSVIKAAAKGDDALLTYVIAIFEKEGMAVIGPQEVCASLLAPIGPLGAVTPSDAHQEDISKARQTAKDIGVLDIGQGAVVCAGLVLAVEAQEGTDAMLTRVASLRPQLRRKTASNGGVLAKMVKPGQETRIDMPTIGLQTIERAIAAELSGIVIEAGRAFILQREDVITAADKAGIFIVGLPQEDYKPDTPSL